MEARQNLKVLNWAKLLGIYFVILVALVIFYMAQDLLTPFLVAFILVYALNPLADKIESWGIKRPWAVAMIFIGFVVVSGLVVSLGFESIKAEITLLKTQVPAYIERIKLSLIDNAAMIEAKIPNMKKGILQNMITQKIGDLPTIIGDKTLSYRTKICHHNRNNLRNNKYYSLSRSYNGNDTRYIHRAC